MSRPITQDCPSCQGSGYGPMGDYSPRLPVCEQCDGTGEVERCLDCAQIIVEGRCACPCECGDCEECSDEGDIPPCDNQAPDRGGKETT